MCVWHWEKLQKAASKSEAAATRGFKKVFFGGKTQSWEKGWELESKEGALSLVACCLKTTRCGDLLSSVSPAVPGLRQVTSGHIFNIVRSQRVQPGASWDLQ